MTDRKFGGSDTYATALTLASGIKYLKKYDLIKRQDYNGY